MRLLLLFILILFLNESPIYAAKIGEVSELNWQEQALRFVSLKDTSVRTTLAGVLLLGISCGLLGTFMVVRKYSLLGDTLSHAVLPGITLGFLWNMSKEPLPLFIGAAAAGIIGAAAIFFLKRKSILKEDSAMGLVLGGFYGIGICLLTMIQSLPTAHQTGLDKFLFGQAAALLEGDVLLIGIITLVSVTAILVFYTEFLLISFDPGFARITQLPFAILNGLLLLLITCTIVISLKAVGVVLVSAMLIIPAATALLLTDRLPRVLGLAVLFGLSAGTLGAFFSFLGHNLPTGPFMVVSAGIFFVIAFLFAPRRGLIPQWLHHRNRSLH